MNNLVIIGHPDKKSFCYSGIFKVVTDNIKELKRNKKNGLCCGAGGSQIFKESEISSQIVIMNCHHELSS